MITTVDKISPQLFANIDILQRDAGNQSTTDTKWHYKNIVCAFDIETTLLKMGEETQIMRKKNIITGKWDKITKTVPRYISIMYIWQFQVGLDITIIGRKWKEFNELRRMIQLGLNKGERLLIFTHNLSYEFSFIRDVEILGRYIDEDSVFMLSSRKVLKFKTIDGKLEFRCSYIHSNMSLEMFTEKMDVVHKKLSGKLFDYSKTRYPWTKLTQYELDYSCNDVIGLVEAIYKEMELDGDTLYTYPLTSTGYVRRDIKKAIRENEPKNYVTDMKPDYETYKLLHDAFRGGNTHANRFMADKTIHERVSECDRSSSYPDVQLNGKFPIGKFHKPRTYDKELFEKTVKRGYCVVSRLRFYNIRLRDSICPVPYISEDKCTILSKTHVSDNGRVLSADELVIALTEVDLGIVVNQYIADKYDIVEYRFASKGELPESVKEVVREYYRRKTRLKGVEGQEQLYIKSKNKLNSVYGNSAQNPGKLSIIYEDGKFVPGYINKKEKITLDTEQHDNETDDEYTARLNAEYEELLLYIYEHTDTCLPYQWGVYTTSLARYELQKMIDICGDNFIYCDTDSVYYIDDGTISFEEYNKEKIAASTISGAYADDKHGITHYMGVAEQEHNDIIAFRTMGAKKYAYITDSGKMKITISGVSTSTSVHEVCRDWAAQYVPEDIAAETLYKVRKSPLDMLDVGYTFYKSGGTQIEYNDTPITCFMGMYIPTNAVITNSTYELGLNDDYFLLLKNNLSETIKFLYNLSFGIPIDISSLL